MREFESPLELNVLDVASVVSRLDDPNALIVEVAFVPGGKEKGYSLRYARE